MERITNDKQSSDSDSPEVARKSYKGMSNVKESVTDSNSLE